jgi:DNA-binding NtrC family response regulator
MLWIGHSDKSDLIANVERQTGLRATVSDGTEQKIFRNLSRYQVVVVDLPVVRSVLESILSPGYGTTSPVPVVLIDHDQVFDESLVRPSRTRFQYVTDRDPAEVVRQIRAATALAIPSRQEVDSREALEKWLIGESRPMQELRALVRLVAPRNSTVLISGETGTGKERVARAIHSASARSASEMVAVNCGALPENLIEAELFGHTKGAFTGAVGARAGRFEQAQNSTLFLDEIGEIPLPLQTRLLRVLQERELQRVGSSETIKIDTRIIAASNCNLPQQVARKRFREDLYYRLNVVPIHVPPLRERASDIPQLVEHFAAQVCLREQLPAKNFSLQAMRLLMNYEWPGNVRQLEHTVEMAVTLSGERETLFAGDIDLPVLPLRRSEFEPGAFERGAFEHGNGAGAESEPETHERGSKTGSIFSRDEYGESAARLPGIEMLNGGIRFEEVMGRVERLLLEQALRSCGGNKAKAAGLLGIKRTTLLYKMKALVDQGCAA